MDIPNLHIVHANHQQDWLKIASDLTGLAIIYEMSQQNTSYGLVMEQQQLVGIVTAKDLVRAIAQGHDLQKIIAVELINQPLVTIDITEIQDKGTIIEKLRQCHYQYLPIIDDQGQVLGVISSENQLGGLMETCYQTLEVRTAQLEKEIANRQLTQKLLSDRETRYRQSQARLNDVLNSAVATSIVSFRLFPNRDWEYDYQSPGCEALFGYTAEEIVSHKTLWMSQVEPEDREAVILPLFESLYAGGTAKVEFRFHHKDGSLRWIGATYTSRYEADGNYWVVTGISSDITQNKKTQAALRQSEERYRAIFDLTFQFVGLLTPEGIVLEANETALNFAGVQLADVINQPIWLTKWWQISSATQEQLKLAIAQAASGEFIRYQVDILGAGDKVATIDFSLKPVKDKTGKVVFLLPEGRDISDIKKTKLEIIRSRDLREAIFNESTDALFLVSTETLLTTDCNNRAVELFEATSKAELIGIEGQTLQKNQFTPQELNSLVTEINQRGFWCQELEYLTKKGNSFWGNLAVKQIQVAGQTMNLVRVTDISDRKRAEVTLQQQETFLRSIYDGVGQPIFVVDVVDDDFRFVGLNPAHERVTGLLTSNLQGKTPEQVLPPILAAQVRRHYQDCVDAGTNISYEECFPLQEQETWWITSLTPLRNEQGKVYRIVGNSVNITEQKHAQQKLELQAVIARNMAEGICLVRLADGVIVYTNRKFEQIFGYDTGELIGQHVSVLNYHQAEISPTDVHQAIAHTVITNDEASYEVNNIKKDGTPFWCRATTSVFEDLEHGKILVAVQQDITEHKQADEKIKASLKEKEVLLQEIHHRVKNNLGIVSSLLQMQSRRTQDAQAKSILLDSQNRIGSIALIHEKLYFSDNLAHIDFAQYITDLSSHLFYSYNISTSRIKMDIQVDHVNLDIEMAIPCGLIINELVSNALKYAFPNNCEGKIKIRLDKLEDKYILVVQDNGIGLPRDFDSKQAQTLGLTLVQGLVKQLKGSIEINSLPGAEFKIVFHKSRV
ncbi:two-component sensor histidine kinase [Richelia sinica FACHB-800]|uniref:Two-component sensor histidine kinase n=1 Tax=Richelia sinica FACHB-800 TaxID=1357546 RepID=A0A975T804_9NOST|nr:PAS domain S-box protein [Richelia sinica]MBD2665957.1 PAS domain S-box protein [Richelia sinica FACHB-800]QXE23931.1 two-component sensor histidine kinase [Richelia sinica FACHB-800]